MTAPQPARILATVRALRDAQSPEEAQAALLDAIDHGLPWVLAVDAWHEYLDLAAASTIRLEASA